MVAFIEILLALNFVVASVFIIAYAIGGKNE